MPNPPSRYPRVAESKAGGEKTMTDTEKIAQLESELAIVRRQLEARDQKIADLRDSNDKLLRSIYERQVSQREARLFELTCHQSESYKLVANEAVGIALETLTAFEEAAKKMEEPKP
jgi:hypothetical protein